MNHPDELLAAFVDGTASLPERAEVEAHLSFCPVCREEIELARGARASLRLLAEVEAPELDRTAFGVPAPAPGAERAGRGRFVDTPPQDLVAAASTPGTTSRPGPARRRAVARWQVRTVQASLVAAAVLIAVAVFANLGSGHRASPAAGSKDSSTVQFAPGESPIRPPAQAYSATSLTRLAHTLAREVQREPQHFSSESPNPAATSADLADGVTAATVSCVQQATGLGGTLYYAQGATYEGTDAYIGAFITAEGQHRSLLVVAVSVDGCRTLRFIRLAI
jgi:anti-sigma factor RsiW